VDEHADQNDLIRLWESLGDPQEGGEYRRNDARRPVPAGLSATVAVGRKQVVATLVNVSQTGLELKSRVRIPERSSVQVCLRDGGQWLRAQIAHCTGTIGGYKIGLRLQDAEAEQLQEPARFMRGA